MILFIGDSFTWGQGLQYYYLTKHKGWTWEDCESFNDGTKRFEWLGFNEDEFRKTHSFPYLVSKELNVPFQVARFENGGDNYVSYEILKNLYPYCTSETLDFVVVQFSSPSRSIIHGSEPKLNTIEEQIELQVSRISNFCNDFNIKWLGISWQEEIGDLLKNKYYENYIPIKYNNHEYSFFDCNTNMSLRNLFIQHTENIDDGHFNLKGHEVIAKSIIYKIKSRKDLLKHKKYR